jgi:cytochrome bd-type quinol oxidase subunit 2
MFRWIYLLMCDVNALTGRRTFNSGAYVGTLLILFLVTIFGVVVLAVKGPSGWADSSAQAISRLIFVTGLLVFAGIIIIIVLLYKYILETCGRALRWYWVVFIIVLTLPWYISLPYLQHKLNVIASTASKP